MVHVRKKTRKSESRKARKHDFGKGRSLDSTQPDNTRLWYTEKGHLWLSTLMWYNGQVKREGVTFRAQRPHATNRRKPIHCSLPCFRPFLARKIRVRTPRPQRAIRIRLNSMMPCLNTLRIPEGMALSLSVNLSIVALLI